jgi:nuclear transport factor 2 (NTF2) superfamily protein
MNDSIRTLAVGYTAAWCSQDGARVAGFYSPEGWLRVNDSPAAVGRDAIREVARGFMKTFPDLRVMLDALEWAEGHPVYRWTLEGTHAVSGTRVRVSGFEEWRIGEDGLIAESRGHFDVGEWERQVSGDRL